MLLMHWFWYLKYTVSEPTPINEAIGRSAVYVIVAFLSYLLTFWSWNMILMKCPTTNGDNLYNHSIISCKTPVCDIAS